MVDKTERIEHAGKYRVWDDGRMRWKRKNNSGWNGDEEKEKLGKKYGD